jgi:hypothetical protein
MEIVKRNQAGFQVLPKRWIVERTLAWLGINRRMAKDFERFLGHKPRLHPGRNDQAYDKKASLQRQDAGDRKRGPPGAAYNPSSSISDLDAYQRGWPPQSS